MSLKTEILQKLSEANGSVVSANTLCGGSVSRNAVWKAVCALKAEGLGIESVSGKGYRLCTPVDFAIGSVIEKMAPGFRVTVLDEADSTNILLRALGDKGEREGAVIIARRQSGGRGRMGRSFYSAEGGLYMSVLLRPCISADKGGDITGAAAVAVAEAVESVTGESPFIKWVNDLFLHRKKICGILTEASVSLEGGMLDYAVVGIGLNVYEPQCGFPEELSQIAGAIYPHAQKRFGLINRLAAEILNRLWALCADKKRALSGYKKRCFIVGQSATAFRGDEEYPVTVLDIDEEYGLVVKTADGEMKTLNSGEIRVKAEHIPI